MFEDTTRPIAWGLIHEIRSLYLCVTEEHYNLTFPGVDLSYADYGMTVVLLVAYLLFVVILVLNMLIAVLGKSFADTLQTSMKVGTPILF